MPEKAVIARLRKFIHDNGKTVGGLSLHESKGRFYFVELDGQGMDWRRSRTVSICDFRTDPHPRRSRTPMTDAETTGIIGERMWVVIHEA